MQVWGICKVGMISWLRPIYLLMSDPLLIHIKRLHSHPSPLIDMHEGWPEKKIVNIWVKRSSTSKISGLLNGLGQPDLGPFRFKETYQSSILQIINKKNKKKIRVPLIPVKIQMPIWNPDLCKKNLKFTSKCEFNFKMFLFKICYQPAHKSLTGHNPPFIKIWSIKWRNAFIRSWIRLI